MTEEQAKQRWCPFARVLLPVSQSGNRISTFYKEHAEGRDVAYYRQQEADCNCIASRCMAWRWRITPAEAAARRTHLLRQLDKQQRSPLQSRETIEEASRLQRQIHVEHPQGYCGLAGIPEPERLP